MKNRKTIFSFGRNWLDYVNKYLDEDKINIAKASLLKYLPEQEYKDKVFIDIGCGSGIFSLNSLRLGCKHVISFDQDKYSIEATKKTKSLFSYLIPQNPQWDIFEGSILDNNLVENLRKQGDIVYSWGVLHHTGNMYQAIKNTIELVKPNGYLILAIYNKAPYSDLWLRIKKIFNQSPGFLKLLFIHVTLAWIFLERFLACSKSIIMGLGVPDFTQINAYRGMSHFYNIVDWIGGYPYEYASFKEIKKLIENDNFELLDSPVNFPSPSAGEYRKTVKIYYRIFLYYYLTAFTGNNEFVFRRKSK